MPSSRACSGAGWSSTGQRGMPSTVRIGESFRKRQRLAQASLRRLWDVLIWRSSCSRMLGEKALESADRWEVIHQCRPELLILPVERCCQLMSPSRSQYHAARKESEPELPGVDEFGAASHEVANERPAHVYRRIGAEFGKRGRSRASKKRVRSRVRKLGLNWRRKARTRTLGKGPASPNLTADLNLTGTHQLLATDLSYAAMPRSFAFISVILDAFSCLAEARLRKAWRPSYPSKLSKWFSPARIFPEGWDQHSDRAVNSPAMNTENGSSPSKAPSAIPGPAVPTTTQPWRASSKRTSTTKPTSKSFDPSRNSN